MKNAFMFVWVGVDSQSLQIWTEGKFTTFLSVLKNRGSLSGFSGLCTKMYIWLISDFINKGNRTNSIFYLTCLVLFIWICLTMKQELQHNYDYQERMLMCVSHIMHI